MTEKRLLLLGSAFLAVYALVLTLSPAAREHSWQVNYHWTHWVGLAVWVVMAWLAHYQLNRHLPERDLYIFPLAAVLSGWGMLTVWRLLPEFGMRQAAWLAVGLALLILGLHLPHDLGFLYRFKYVWLTAGLLLTATTLVLGTNPMGQEAGPHLWLGCCGLYMQPSEILKLLLVIYMAAYFADRLKKNGAAKTVWLPFIAPTLLVIGSAILLLIFQRDLGTASIFLFLYAALMYIATEDWRVGLVTVVVMAAGVLIGYLVFDVVRLRVDAWLNPWIDPSARSYQIVQSLIAVANGGIFGRGVGMGSPGLVPVAQSDFIFAAIAEESGLLGSLALILMTGWLVNRGMRAALLAATPFQRYLAAGITAHIGAQSILIIAGNLRLLPLTGVTLPLVSYGGSSLVTSLLEVLLLLLISTHVQPQSAPVFAARPYKTLAGALLLGLSAVGLTAGWWSVWRSPDLVERTDNVRRAINDRYVLRGAIVSQDGTALSLSSGTTGQYQREYAYPDLGAILGYTDPIYGQAGLEASLDDYLRGLQGNEQLTVWWNHLLYGQPPPGLDVRLSLKVALQRGADELLGERKGALVLLNAQSGEILAIASHPTFDANRLEADWQSLSVDEDAPLFNRATMGLYPTGAALGGLLIAAQRDPANLPVTSGINRTDCAVQPANRDWSALVSAGCPGAVKVLGNRLGVAALMSLYEDLGFFTAPNLRLPTAASTVVQGWNDAGTAALGLPDPATGDKLLVSPLQMALASASLSQRGVRPAPRLAVAMNTPESGWVMLLPEDQPVEVFTSQAADIASEILSIPEQLVWQLTALAWDTQGNPYSWYLAGTHFNWPGAPLTLAVVIEENNPLAVLEIGNTLLQEAMQP